MRVVCRRCGRVHDAGACLVGRARPGGPTEAQAFRGSAEWQRCRAEARRLDGGTCVMCMELDGLVTAEGLEGHHVVPLGEGGLASETKSDPDWVATLCAACHRRAERGDVSRAELLELIGRHRARFA